MSAYSQILTETVDRVRVITLNRPERLNAWTDQMSRELDDALTTANEDHSVGAIVVTGAGRGFCAGADMADKFQADLNKAGRDASDASGGGGGGSDGGDAETAGEAEATAASGGKETTNLGWGWVELVRASKPLVAAINGPAIGLGLSMILPFDRLIAGRSARLSARFIKVGVVPELASSRFLPQRVGFGAASDMMLSGRIIDAPEAERIGLVDELVDDEELLATAITRAQEYGVNAPPHLRWVKELLTLNAGESDLRLIQRREADALRKAYVSPEHTEAVSAFLEKREPNFGA